MYMYYCICIVTYMYTHTCTTAFAIIYDPIFVKGHFTFNQIPTFCIGSQYEICNLRCFIIKVLPGYLIH